MIRERLNKSHKRYGLAGVVAAVIAICGSIGIAVAASTGGQGKAVQPSPPNLATPDKPDASVIGRLKVLRQSSASTAATLGQEDEIAMSRARQHFGLDLASARKVTDGVGDNPMYLVPGSGYVCLTGHDAGNACVAAADLAKAQPQVFSAECGTIPAGKIAIYGIVPDDVTSLTALTGKDSQSIEVANNAFFVAFDVSNAPSKLTWDGPDGSGSLDLDGPVSGTASCS